jgi:N-acetylglucosamine-6-phosphate deacetylase
MDDRLSAEIIADGIHVDPLMVSYSEKPKADAAALVTDGTSATGMPNGRY